MIIALDIETVGNPKAVALLPEPECTDARIKDPAKIADHIAAKKTKQIEDAALDPLTARIICYAAVGQSGAQLGEIVDIVPELTDAAETALVQSIMRLLGTEEVRLATWNGMGFDLPMIYRRAMILGVAPADFGAPPLSAWTKRYNTDRHFDLMQIWAGWNSQNYAKLDTVARLVLKARKTDGVECETFAALMESVAGRKIISEYCINDTRITYELWKRFNGFLFV